MLSCKYKNKRNTIILNQTENEIVILKRVSIATLVNYYGLVILMKRKFIRPFINELYNAWVR